MKDLFLLANELEIFLEQKKWLFCYIGGLALQRWGENRLTNDIDVTLLTGFSDEESYIDELIKKYEVRRKDARQFALQYRVLLLQSKSKIGIDISLAGMPFEKNIIKRSSKFEFLPECNLRTCSAEDLIILKSFAARPKDWLDVRGIIIRQKAKIDKKLILNELKPLVELKEEPEILDKLERLFNEFD